MVAWQPHLAHQQQWKTSGEKSKAYAENLNGWFCLYSSYSCSLLQSAVWGRDKVLFFKTSVFLLQHFLTGLHYPHLYTMLTNVCGWDFWALYCWAARNQCIIWNHCFTTSFVNYVGFVNLSILLDNILLLTH